MKAAEFLPQEARAMLHDIDQAFAIPLFQLALGGDGDEEARLFDAARPIGWQFLPALDEGTEHQFGPVERLAVGELNEFVH